jgi:transcriptional regulator with XRE-family HTH domain
MDDSQKSRKPSSKPGINLKQGAQSGKLSTDGPDKRSEPENSSAPSLSGVLNDLKQEVAGSALRVAAKAGGASLKMGKALLLKPEKRKIFREAGLALKDLRNLAGMTQNEVSDALKLKDTSLLKAIEDGTAALSFELILRLAALYSRHDPIPFIIKYTRTYSPAIWKLLDDWGIGRLPLYIEREREFVNIYRNHDRVRKLSDEAFEKLLTFTRAAFEMALHFISKKES